MLRLVHNQTVSGPILVDDIDDGLPNKEVYRLGSQGDPAAYKRDGYANYSKQPCYVPYSHSITGGGTTNGYINLNQTNRVILSNGSGKISKLATAGLISVVSFLSTDVVAPVITASVHTDGSGHMTITGTTLTSVSPDVTTVTLAQGTGATAPSPATWTQSAITTAGGTISATSIVIPLAAFTTAPALNNTVKVTANEQTSNTFTMT